MIAAIMHVAAATQHGLPSHKSRVTGTSARPTSCDTPDHLSSPRSLDRSLCRLGTTGGLASRAHKLWANKCATTHPGSAVHCQGGPTSADRNCAAVKAQEAKVRHCLGHASMQHWLWLTGACSGPKMQPTTPGHNLSALMQQLRFKLQADPPRKAKGRAVRGGTY
jgi:hypothetical protein